MGKDNQTIREVLYRIGVLAGITAFFCVGMLNKDKENNNYIKNNPVYDTISAQADTVKYNPLEKELR